MTFMASLFCDSLQCNPNTFGFWLASCVGFEGLLVIMEMPPDGFGGFAGDYGGERFGGGLLHVTQAAEVGEQALAGLRAYAGDVQQLGIAVAHGAALAMIADGEAMALVADELDEMQHRRAAIKHHRLVFVAVEVDDLFAFGNRRQRLRGEAEGFEGLGGGVKLAQAAVDEDQRGQVLGSLEALPSGAKAPSLSTVFAARLKSCPFKVSVPPF